MMAIASALSHPKISIVVSCGVGMYFGVGIFLVYSFGVFIKPISDDTGWDRTHIAAAIAPAALLIGMMSPLVGAATDRFGPRRVLVISSLGLATGLVGIGVASSNLTAFVVAVLAASILGSAQTFVPYTYVLVGWFDARRGLALGLALAFSGLGIATVPAILSTIIAAWGWRAAFVSAGLAALAITLPLALFIIRDPPARQLADVRGMEGTTLREAVGTSSFWMMLAAFLLTSMTAVGGSVSLPLVLADRGVSSGQAALALSVVGATIIIARIGFGALIDRVPAVPVTSLLFLAPMIGHLLLAHSEGTAAVFVAAVFFGLATGAEGDAIGYLLARRFGMRSFGRIYGINFFAFSLGSGLGPSLVTYLAANGTRYTEAFTTFSAISVVAAILLLSQWRTTAASRPRAAHDPGGSVVTSVEISRTSSLH